jgi:hypothetical protein
VLDDDDDDNNNNNNNNKSREIAEGEPYAIKLSTSLHERHSLTSWQRSAQ